ncbi:bifunctional UDP-N-acetylglucosamine diphosphorylase/glucosamine-1-phosphate N-acetyltransferase GlmU [Salinisphaera orenii]|uniref:bifunctional UDP-N-acetylglucosamine diphosphorylase/glucosamine-1-phosphate N-acetyltransferase GlmU n=1 Tax=Salinisphaera orenii TaxID=856731 RepID=UPI000DBE2F67
MTDNLHIVVLAAGSGTRMGSAHPKVLAPLGEWPLLRHVVATAETLEPTQIHVVCGAGVEQIRTALGYLAVNWVEQPQPLGTGDAVAAAMDAIPDHAQVLVLYGDVPLVRPRTLTHLLTTAASDGMAILTTELAEPAGYGRIVRDAAGGVAAIVEDKDLAADQRTIREINTGLMVAPAAHLRDWLARLSNDNAQGEYLLTDCIAMAVADHRPVVADPAETVAETQGINDRRDLACAERVYQQRRNDDLLAAGVTLRDPARVDVRGRIEVGRDVLIDVDVVLEGEITLGDGVHIEAGCVIRHSVIGDGGRVMAHTVVEHAHLATECQVGPFARIRPGTELGHRARIGNFVETKNASVGASTKVNHLSYVGDAALGTGVNIGAGVITCNYDGANKHVTTIGDDAFVGSNSELVAPVEIGAGATIAAGTTLTKAAPPNQLSLTRKEQVAVDNWRRPKKNR